MKKTSRSQRGKRITRIGKAGLPPGTPVFIGERKQDVVKIDIIGYSGEHLEELHGASVDDCGRLRDTTATTIWVNVIGIHDVDTIQKLANLFGLHPLTTEDISNTNQRPKVEEYENYIFFAIKMLGFDKEIKSIAHENVSIILGDTFVISFQEVESKDFDSIKERIRSNKGRIRKEGAHYLAYTILDRVVDEYFVSLDELGDHIEDIDDEILAAPKATHLRDIHRLKREIVFLRKAVWPLREEIATIAKTDSPLIGAATKMFFRDLHDHTVQIIDLVETYREIISGMHDTFLSGNSNKMNEIMKVLTIIGTIFIPLTFIAGVYGMNFTNMPELQWRWGYYMVLSGMAGTGDRHARFLQKTQLAVTRASCPEGKFPIE
jgi:magnesium transporter